MEIPSKYTPKEVELKGLEKWQKEGCFNAEADSGRKPFCIVIPPPNITGILHMGHALNNTLQDVLIRFKRMRGFESLWMPGTDHAGIATQNVVEKEIAKQGLKKEDLGREEFSKRLWAWKEQYGSTILMQLKKLGASCDWRRTRFTMDDDYSEKVKEVFVELYNKGLIYRGNYIINWCPRCKTALSDEESLRQEKEGWLYYIKYPVIKRTENTESKIDYIVVATTRPETMLGDTAVAINHGDIRYAGLIGAEVMLPLVNRRLKVIQDELVDPEFGTGVVKVTPAHDPVDFSLGKKHGLEFINIMDDGAVLNENVPREFRGMDRFKARKELLKILEEKGLIEKKEPYTISAGHCYRCQTMVEPRLSLQWFVKMKPLAERAVKAVEEDEIKFYPQRWKKVYLNWMNNIHDWCISRQIWWGHRLPVYYCNNCIKTESRNEKLKNVIVSKTKPEKCPDCGSQDIYQDDDVLDTWFSSWLWPFATFQDQKPKAKNQRQEDLEYFYPTDVLVTAPEILFFWVARMIMAGLEFMNAIPFKDVIIHGTVRDSRGIKMSKSLGNIIDPLEIIDKFGADSLRFSLMMLAASGSDVYLSDEKFLVGRNFANKIWNAARFILLKIKEMNITIENLDLKRGDNIDSWIFKKLDQTIEKATFNLESYRINEATKNIYDFFWHDFCDWYIEIVKDTFNAGRAKNSIYILIASIKILHPLMPFLTEEIFQLVKKYTLLNPGDNIMKSLWPEKSGFGEEDTNDTEITERIIETIKELRNIKNDLGLGMKKVKLEVKIKNEKLDFWKVNQAWIQRLTFSSEIEFKSHLSRVIYKNDDWELNLDMQDMNIKSFILSVEKKAKDLETVGDKILQRLNNDNFLKNADEEKVEQEKIKYKEISVRVGRLKDLKAALVKG